MHTLNICVLESKAPCKYNTGAHRSVSKLGLIGIYDSQGCACVSRDELEMRFTE